MLTGAARQVAPQDLKDFDYVIAMDEENLANVHRLAKGRDATAEIRLLREFDERASGNSNVPDPYYGGPRGFEDVHDIVERSCRSLLAHIRREHGL